MTTKTVTIDGVRIDHSLCMSSLGDDEVSRHDTITLTAVRPVSVEAMGRAYHAAQKLEMVRSHQAYMSCPVGDTMLSVVGIDDLGDLLIQIWRGEKKCSIVPSRDLAHLDPDGYSQSGVQVMASVAWMRDCGRALRDATSTRKLDDAIYTADQVVLQAATVAESSR